MTTLVHESLPRRLYGRSRAKILSLGELAAKARQLREQGLAVVQAHGAFDLLHLGHVRHLEAAARLGDALVVTISADRFINKGPGRPVFSDLLRAEMLAALEQYHPDRNRVITVRVMKLLEKTNIEQFHPK